MRITTNEPKLWPEHSRYRTPEPFAQLTLALFGSIALTAASLAAETRA